MQDWVSDFLILVLHHIHLNILSMRDTLYNDIMLLEGVWIVESFLALF